MECGVCFNEFTIDGLNRPMTLVPCGHALCYDCCPKIKNCPECTLLIEKAIPNRLVLECISGVSKLKEEHTLMKKALRDRAEAREQERIAKDICVSLKNIIGKTLNVHGTLNTRCGDLKDHIIRSWNRNNDEIRHLICNGRILANDDTFGGVNIKDGDVIYVVFHAL